ncbi:MAG: NAD(P)-binding protein [Cyclobacteriaceae bacterium]
MSKRIMIIGAGISAVSQAQILCEKGVDCSLLEKSALTGGLISCTDIKGNLYHKVGGHVFNSKNQNVLDWFWKHFDREHEFVHAERNAKVLLEGQYIGYPIENHLFQLPNNIVKRVINEWFGSGHSDSSDGSDFQTFLVNRFGPTLYKLYFGPYNEKIWQTDLSEVSLDWLEGKLPMPNLKDSIVQNILKKEENEMVHSSFYYPKQGGSQFIIDRLGEELDIRTNYEVRKIQKTPKGWLINDELEIRQVVYTGDIRQLLSILHGVEDNLIEACKAVEGLPSNGTSNVLCETDGSDLSWLYLPDPATKAHRIIYTGNFSVNNNAPNGRLTCTVEFSGKVSEAEMTAEVANLPGNLKVLASNYEPNSYVIQTHDTRVRVDRVRQLLQKEGFFLLGRFAEWEYYNMDKCIERAMILTDQIIDGR